MNDVDCFYCFIKWIHIVSRYHSQVLFSFLKLEKTLKYAKLLSKPNILVEPINWSILLYSMSNIKELTYSSLTNKKMRMYCHLVVPISLIRYNSNMFFSIIRIQIEI